MNRLFQALLLRLLTENLPSYEVHAEERIRKMIRFSPGANPRNRSAPQPRPDFMVRKKGKVAAILDAKYRDLWERHLPREMLYQLSIYALSQSRAATATILYPTMDVGAVDAVLQLRDPSVGDVMGFVALRPVVLSKLRSALEGAGAKSIVEAWLRPASSS